jgi:LmbE family N-acetylglucosaminyl deacetylase
VPSDMPTDPPPHAPHGLPPDAPPAPGLGSGPELPPDLPILRRAALVMAHPDDEVLWASSILARMERIVLAFGPVAAKPALTKGRRRAMEAFPLPGAEHLDLAEAGVFAAAAWPEPRETADGLAVAGRADAATGFSPARYAENRARLAELLLPRLAGFETVVTHAPWGEYGHEEHVQVFRAVEEVASRLGIQVWVPGYCSDLSMPLMRRHLGRLGPPTPFLPTDPALGDRLRRLYQENACWTWFDDYLWPEREVFYPWLGAAGTDAPPKGRVHPVNHVWRGPRPPLPSLPRRLALRARRAAGRLARGAGLAAGARGRGGRD